MAAAASRTTNPILLLLIVAVVAFVVSARRTEAPWARGFRAYVYLALLVIGIRVVFRMLLDAQYGTHILFTLPEVPLPEAVAGIRLGGAVSAEGMLAAIYDGLRLATLLLCIGAANTLANPKRLLQSMPAALHEIGVAVTVALSVAPQLIESGQRVHRARRLRGEPRRRFHIVREVALPVMTDALDRSLLLAAAMDARGYGRTAARARVDRGPRRAASWSAASWRSRSAPTGSWTAPHRATSGCRCCSAGWRSGGSAWCRADAGSSGVATARTRGGSRSGVCPSSASPSPR